MKTDSQIQNDVMQALKWDPSITHEHIGVAVSDGIVTLSGAVPNYLEKIAAEKTTQKVAGVRAVVEKIEVRFYLRDKKDDQDIAKAILNNFKWNIQVPDRDLNVRVENGWVKLSGAVEWDFQRKAAERAAEGISGVRGVSNEISLRDKKVEPANIKQKIEDALKREAELEARRISIDVKTNGEVVLTGKVRSFAEMEDVKWAAWSAPGVRTIENKMQVGS